jgi:hypothetical protein
VFLNIDKPHKDGTMKSESEIFDGETSSSTPNLKTEEENWVTLG